MSGDRGPDREAFRQALQEEEFADFLGALSGNGLIKLDHAVEALGEEVQNAVNRERIDQFQPPVDSRHKAIGYLALLYESENGTRVEEELSELSLDSTDRPEVTSD